MFNRKQYMAGECSHQEYYEQFCNNSFVRTVVNRIGVQSILQSTDPHLNDIPLQKWDNLAPLAKTYAGSAIAKANASTSQGNIPTLSLSDLVCVSKAAARIYKRRHDAGELPRKQEKKFHKICNVSDLGRSSFWVTIQYDDECENGHETFSITGEIRASTSKDWDMCGCVHDEIAQCFPELAKYIKWHLCSSDGPLYYIANTVYLAGLGNLEAARSSAIAPDATLEQLRDRQWLEDRLPGLMAEFRADIEELGFLF